MTILIAPTHNPADLHLVRPLFRSVVVPMLRTRRRAIYDAWLTHNFIVLEDAGLTPNLSLTNDAEDATRELMAVADAFFHNRPIIYRDSVGEWDVLLVEAGKFKDFRIYRADSPAPIIHALVGDYPHTPPPGGLAT